MSWMKIGLLASIIFALYYYQQIKMVLKDQGYDVDLLTGWLTDYRRFKELTLKEKDEWNRVKYQGLLNGLHLALLGFVVIAGFMLFGN